MKDDQLIADVEAVRKDYPDNGVVSLRENGITTYTRMFAVLRDEAALDDLRGTLCWVVLNLYKTIDKRRAAPSLIACLQASDAEVVASASAAAGQLGIKYAIPHLTKIATDRAQTQKVRFWAINALGGINDERAEFVLQDIFNDETDDISCRADALEWSAALFGTQLVDDYIRYLSHDSADLRFWSAFGLTHMLLHLDNLSGLEALDKVVAFDHVLPAHWGWHVDREALFAFEGIYQDLLVHDPDDTPSSSERHPSLISPAPEYQTFVNDYRHWNEGFIYTTDPTPPITFRVDPQWFANCLMKDWPTIKLDVRQPRPQAYLLDFLLNIDDHTLIGGLHRDGYALVVTGHLPSFQQFAKWYRGLFPPEQKLYLYEWAGEGVLL